MRILKGPGRLHRLDPKVGDTVQVVGGPNFKISKISGDSYFCDDLAAPKLSNDLDFYIVEALGEPIRDTSSQPKGGWWIHKKTGHRYEIVTFALIEATLEQSVVYRSEKGQVWIRPADEFFDGRFQQEII